MSLRLVPDQPRPVRKPWWDTPLASSFGMKGLATLIVGRTIAYLGPPQPDNDRDHLRW